MDNTKNVDLLFSQFQEQLSLRWIAGQGGNHRSLHCNDGTHGYSLVGHLNTIHPNRLQILGKLELEYLADLDDDSRQELIDQLFQSRPAALIIAEDITIPDDIKALAEKSETPLFSSSQDSKKIITILRHFFDETQTEKTVLHGVLLEVHGMGVLLTGESGIGKSELALELITRNHRLIADDAPEFSRVDLQTVRGSCPEALQNFLEVRGLGILNIRSMYGDSAIKLSKDLRLIIRLEKLGLEAMREVNRLEGSYSKQSILEVDIPMVTIPVAPGRNLAVLVEAAVKHHILLRKGYNSSDDFISQQRNLIKQQNTDNP